MLAICAILLASCATSSTEGGNAPRAPVSEQELAALNDYGPLAGKEDTQTFQLESGTFFVSKDRGYCYQVVSTADCGLRGTVTPQANYWTRVADGRVAKQQYSTAGEDMRPILRRE